MQTMVQSAYLLVVCLRAFIALLYICFCGTKPMDHAFASYKAADTIFLELFVRNDQSMHRGLRLGIADIFEMYLYKGI